MVYQGLDDLTAACVEAAEGDCQVEAFEVGVFCGNYMTGVPENYFEHLSQLRQGKKAQAAKAGLTAIAPGDAPGNAVVVANSGPVNVVQASTDDDAATNGNSNVNPNYGEDIRFVTINDILRCFSLTLPFLSLHNIASEHPNGER